jgi:hypothetical protein
MDWWTHIWIVTLGTWDEHVCGAERIGAVRAICAVNTNAALPFTDCPLNGIYNKTKDEADKETWKMNMKGLFFFLCKFCFYVRKIARDGGMIIIVNLALSA